MRLPSMLSTGAVALGLTVLPLVPAAAQSDASASWRMKPLPIATRWAKDVNPHKVLPEYPRPQLVRSQWTNLNGLWQYAITPAEASTPGAYAGQILVPYPIESALSGVQRPLSPTQALWYQRTFKTPARKANERVLLQFGAVDWDATVTVNGREVCRHKGGYTAFSCDITDALKGPHDTLRVKVLDPSDRGPNPHGKQVLNPEGIMYTPSSGIWQTVWLEVVPAVSVASLRMTPDVDRGQLQLQVNATGADGYTVEAVALSNGKAVGRIKGQPNTPLSLSIPSAHLWSPDDPFLYDLRVRLVKSGKTVDEVTSYFGMRKIELKDSAGVKRIFLNNKYTYNLGTLDQGFWPDGLYTAPTDAALKFDIEAIKAMGFNTIRKHIKVEPARWYYYTDQLGMLVWQDLVNPGSDNAEGRAEFEKESADILAQLYNTPSVTTYVVFNERWGAYDQKRLTEWVKSTDPTRLVNGHSGELLYVNERLRAPSDNPWVSSDIADVHAYPNPRPVPTLPGKASVIGEFGGIGVSIPDHLWDDMTAGWGYGAGTVTIPMMRQQYAKMMDSVKTLEGQNLTGTIYTQPFDVESEQNGLMTYDRAIIKVPFAELRRIHARVWPATANVDRVTSKVAVGVTVADTAPPPEFATLLAAFDQGRRDSAFTRKLALMALARRDGANAVRIATAHIQQLRDPLSPRNRPFVARFTRMKADTGFALMRGFLRDTALVRGAPDSATISRAVQGVIFNEQVRPLLTDTPDWAAVDRIIASYPEIDGEFVIGSSVIHYLRAFAGDGPPNAANARNFVDIATRYDDRFHDGAYNQWAWSLFQRSADTLQLKKALEWSEKALAKESASAAIMDTRANLLYKLGRRDEAIAQQEKAVAASGGDAEIRANLEKMQKGQPTW